MDEEDQVTYRDAFLGTAQRHRRILQAIRFPLVVNISRPSNTIPASGLKNLLQALYCSRGEINVVAQSQNKMMIMFSDDEDARIAYKQLHNRTISDSAGPILHFKIWTPVDDLGYDVADHHIYISIRGLPQHLWNKDVVEQIMHPFCALGHISDETRTRRDLSSYTAFAWSQKRVKMPRRISLKVTKEISGDHSLSETEEYKEVSVYNLSVDSVGFLCDPMTECSCNVENLNVRYEPAYEPDNAQCFLTEPPENRDLFDELSYAVIAAADQENHGYQKEEVQDMISSYMGCAMKVHQMNGTQFMILPPSKSVGKTAKEILLDKQTFSMSLTTFTMDCWRPYNMSTVERLAAKVTITVNEIPAHLCTPKVIQFVLSPYCAPNISSRQVQPMTTSEKFTCTALTNRPMRIPKRIMTALFVREPDAEGIDEGNSSADLRITQLIIDTTRVEVQ